MHTSYRAKARRYLLTYFFVSVIPFLLLEKNCMLHFMSEKRRKEGKEKELLQTIAIAGSQNGNSYRASVCCSSVSELLLSFSFTSNGDLSNWPMQFQKLLPLLLRK